MNTDVCTVATQTRSARAAVGVALVDLPRQYDELGEEIDAAIRKVMQQGAFILGEELALFEEEFAAYCGARHCVGVGSGLSALTLALKGLGIGATDEVILPANTFIATALAVTNTGATPVLVDHDRETYNISPQAIELAITKNTRAIIPVHLYGQPADMDQINAIADQYGLIVVEDAAQAHGATYQGRGTGATSVQPVDRHCGSLGQAAAFSFYPGKNLGAFGDGGAVVTNDDDLANWLKTARNYGSTVKYRHDMVGVNSRLDNLQAAVLRIKLRHLDRWNQIRRDTARTYCERLADLPIVLPREAPDRTHVYHLFVCRCGHRDALLDFLKRRGIAAGIHYPVPIHRQRAYQGKCVIADSLTYAEAFSDQLISLPMHPHLSGDDIERVCTSIREFPSDLTPKKN